MTILEGKVIAEEIYDKMAPEVFELREKGIYPHLAAVLVGDNPDSALYVSLKEKQAKKLGIDFSVFHIKDHESDKEIFDVIDYLNKDEHTHGIIIQLPLPSKFDTEKVLERVSEAKDVDGLKKDSIYQPPAPMAITKILEYYDIDLFNKNIVIMGRGRLVGLPLERIMKKDGLAAESADENTSGLIDKVKKADILIAATGADGIITEELVHPDMIVIAVGKEVNFERVQNKVEALTPPVGGVGPLTIAFLLKNTVEAAKKTTRFE